MMKMQTVLSAMAGAAAVALQVASAGACETDADCGSGYICESYESYASCDRPQVDCAEGDEACWQAVDDGGAECDAEPVLETYCARSPCEADADCGSDMVCVEQVSSWCTGTAVPNCSPDGTCDVPEPVEDTCGTTVTHECGYRYEGDCEVDSDCGGGFSCVASEVCACSGGVSVAGSSSGAGGASGDPAGTPPPDTDGGVAEDPGTGEGTGDYSCTCEPADYKYCQLQDLPCDADVDCPAGLTCHDVTEGSCTGDSSGNVECSTTVTARVCQPDSWSEGGGIDLGGGNGSDASGSDGGPGATTPPTDDSGTPGGEVDDDSPDHGGPGRPGWGWGWAPRPWAPWAGCSVAAPTGGSASGAGFISLLGLALLSSRRRR